jgi:hypothetical protein
MASLKVDLTAEIKNAVQKKTEYFSSSDNFTI